METLLSDLVFAAFLLAQVAAVIAIQVHGTEETPASPLPQAAQHRKQTHAKLYWQYRRQELSLAFPARWGDHTPEVEGSLLHGVSHFRS